MKRRIVSALLCAALLLSAAAGAFAAAAPFHDVTDEKTRVEVDALRMMGVIEGDGTGNFNPSGSLTRAAFAKMAVIVMGKGDLEPTYRNRTIFPDVRSSHWARGYVNLAAAGEPSIIKGTTGGRFEPDSSITYGQAVTLVMRMLGYTDADTGLIWPNGYLELAAQVGLTKGLSLSAGANISRAQAVHLFCNLLNTPKKEGGLYCASLGSVTQDAVILALDVAAEDGSNGAVRTSEGVMKVKSGVAPQSMLGQKGNLIVNEKGEIITLIPTGGESKTITVSAANSGQLTDSSGARYTVPKGTVAYTSEGKAIYDTDNVWMDIYSGARVTLYYTSGKLTGLYVNTAPMSEAVVVTGSATAASFRTLTGGATNCPVYKNGQRISYSDIQPYDVVTYNAGALTVSGLKVAGVYENVTPNVEYPSTVTVMGHPFTVLPSAASTFSGLKLGQSVTLLLTADGQVAAAYPAGKVQSETLATAKGNYEQGAEAEFELLGTTITLRGTLSSGTAVKGQLVKLTSYEKGKLRVEKLPTSTAPGSFDAQTMKLGSYTVAAGAVLGDRVGDGPVVPITLDDVPSTRVASGKISYYHLSGNVVDVLIFNDLTGDCYTYGRITSQVETVTDSGFTMSERTMKVENKNGTVSYVGGGTVSGGMRIYGGVAQSGNGRVANWLTLSELRSVPRSAFTTVDGRTYCNHGGQSFPVADGVQCYNNVSGTWFEDLTQCRAFSNNLTVYYDRPAAEGGKIRVVVAN